MKNVESMTVAELESLAGRVELLLRERRMDERVQRELPGRARFPRVDGERGWLEAEKVKCGQEKCRKGCREGVKSHGPYWYLYTPKARGEGLKSEYKYRELPADVATAFGLPPGLDAGSAHQYSRQAREAEILQTEPNAKDKNEVDAPEVATAEPAPADIALEAGQ